MRYAGEIRSRGMVEGVEGEQDDAPFAVCVLLEETGARPLRLLGPHEDVNCRISEHIGWSLLQTNARPVMRQEEKIITGKTAAEQ